MPPPSPVWAWDYKNKGAKVFSDTKLQMSVGIEGVPSHSNFASLKVKDPHKKVEKK